MVKKIIGSLFFVAAILGFVGAAVNGTLAQDLGSAAATYGSFVGTLIPVIAYILSGIFLFSFDNIYKNSYIDGFMARKKQCSKITTFLIVFGIMSILAAFGAGLSGLDNIFTKILTAMLPYFIPAIVFSVMSSIYVIPYQLSIKNCNLDEIALNAYLSSEEVFYTYTEDNSVLASNKVLFFPKIYCVIPFDQIASTKFYNMIEQDIIFTLTNKNKVEIVAGKKQYAGVLAAIEANKQ